jgi:hypothetical protein
VIQHDVTTSVVRFYKDDNAKWGDPYDAVCTLLWESDTVVEAIAFHGNVTHKMYTEFLRWMVDNGIEELKASRHGNHLVPGGVVDSGGMVHMDVKSLANRRKQWK